MQGTRPHKSSDDACSLAIRKRARREPRRVRQRLIAAVDERGRLWRVIHRPIDLPTLVVEIANLRVEGSFMTVLEDVASERKDHRRVVWRLHDVFVRPCRRVSPRRSTSWSR